MTHIIFNWFTGSKYQWTNYNYIYKLPKWKIYLGLTDDNKYYLTVNYHGGLIFEHCIIPSELEEETVEINKETFSNIINSYNAYLVYMKSEEDKYPRRQRYERKEHYEKRLAAFKSQHNIK